MGNTTKADVIELGGVEFKRVKDGLDEAQVASFIEKLIGERGELAQSQNHITSLSRLAEKTIAEADRLAEQIKTEAKEQAKAESVAIVDKAKEQAKAKSAAIVDKAKEQAQQLAEKTKAEAVEIANEQAEAIRSEAEKKAALLLENEREKIQCELSNFINQQLGYLLEKLESLKQQAANAQVDFDNKLSKSREAGSAIKVEFEEESNAITMKEGEVLDESAEAIQATDRTDKTYELSKLFKIEEQSELGEPQLEVEILPPLDIDKMMEVVAYLDQLPEVENTEIIPRMDTPSILIFLRESIDVVDVLETTPSVAHVEEVITGKDAGNGEPRKVRIGLSVNETSQEKK